MTGDPLPDDDHFAHYCSPRQIDDDGRPAAHAFLPRESEEYLSANWLEYFGVPRAAAIECVRDALGKKNFTLRRSGRLAVLNVGTAKKAARDAGNETLCVDHQPEEGDPSHSGIGGYTRDDMLVGTALQSVVQAMLPAISDG